MTTIKAVPQYLVFTAIGTNQTGLVSELTGLVYECGCNVVDSKMAIFSSEFSMIMLLEGSQQALVQLESQLPVLALELDLLTMMKRTSPTRQAVELDDIEHHFVISIEGPDRAGTIKELTSLLADKEIDISSLRSELIKKPNQLYQTAQIEVCLNDVSQLAQLESDIKKLSEKFEMEFSITSITVK